MSSLLIKYCACCFVFQTWGSTSQLHNHARLFFRESEEAYAQRSSYAPGRRTNCGAIRCKSTSLLVINHSPKTKSRACCWWTSGAIKTQTTVRMKLSTIEALTSRVALIQGPPGTDKKFLALRILRSLLNKKIFGKALLVTLKRLQKICIAQTDIIGI